MRSSISSVFVLLICALPAAAFDPTAGDYSRDNPLHIRLMAYNTQRNFISTPGSDDAFNRILVAIDPDVIVFEEIETNVAQSTMIARLNAVLPPASGSWQVQFGLSGGIRSVLASRYPLADTRADTIPASATRGVTIGRIDLPDAIYADDIYVMGVHLKAFSGTEEDALRQQSADAITNWLADARGVPRPFGNNIVLPASTPMIVMGDFNLVGPSTQPELTLINGDIQNEVTYGPDVKGDWDNTDMGDLMPADPFTGDTDSWPSNTTNPFARLDRFIYTDSTTQVANSFILNTLNMNGAALAGTGLQSTDTTESSTADHLPIVMDIAVVQDCNNNSIPDEIEIAAGTATDCNANMLPDDCESLNDCNNNSIADLCDIASEESADCNNNIVPDECEDPADCNVNGVQDICDIAGGTSIDCDGNNVPDLCDIQAGAEDCDANNILDVCEPDEDCNNNGTQDICDIANQTSIDCDGNSVPDSCELDGTDNIIVLASNFETQFPPTGWAASGMWHGSTVCPRLNDCDPITWAYFGQDGVCNFATGLAEAGTLASPPVSIPANALSATLTYCSAYNGEGGNANFSGWDWAYVAVNGAEIDDAGNDGIQNEWEVRTVDLDAFIGQTINLEWRFDSRDGTSNSGLGWQVDNIELIAPTPVDRDCNENGTLDSCDIASGTATDCNLDGIPDQCGPDCDANNIPDVCDAVALLTTQPEDNERCLGDNANFSVMVSEPTATIQWFKGVTPLVNGGTISGATSANLTITNVSETNEDNYRCMVTDGCVVAASNFARLEVVGTPATITSQPAFLFERCAGEVVSFSVTAAGSEPLHYEWRKDGQPFDAPDAPTLNLTNVSTDDTADYTCFVSNACGSELSTVGELRVGGGVFLQHPADQCAETGTTVVLEAAATGSGFIWAWTKDGIGLANGGQISGASSGTLTITNATVANAGEYKAFAYNTSPLCVNSSNPATLTVDGCNPCPTPGDFDDDGDVDLSDVQVFVECFEANVFSKPACQCVNLSAGNSIIDLADWEMFAPLLTGP
jgi:endonuclease/exonuclease/phosphatase family metal-dependent hydrolase